MPNDEAAVDTKHPQTLENRKCHHRASENVCYARAQGRQHARADLKTAGVGGEREGGGGVVAGAEHYYVPAVKLRGLVLRKDTGAKRTDSNE